jgi:hypothetical protein
MSIPGRFIQLILGVLETVDNALQYHLFTFYWIQFYHDENMEYYLFTMVGSKQIKIARRCASEGKGSLSLVLPVG